MPNLTERLAFDFADHGIALARLSTAEMKKLNRMLRNVQKDLELRLMDADTMSLFRRAQLQSVLNDVRTVTRTRFTGIASEFDDFLDGVASTESRVVAKVLNKALGVDVFGGLAADSTLRSLVDDHLILGAPAKEWWERQADKLAQRFMDQMRLGIAQGETVGQLIQRVRGGGEHPGVMSATRNAAEAVVRTSVQSVANSARLETFKNNRDLIKGVQQVSTLDNRTSDICIAYDGGSWDLNGHPINGTTLPFAGGPPRHWNCRSVLVPVVKSWKEIGVDVPEFQPTVRASMDGQVAAKQSFDDWLANRSEAQQEQILGKGKAALWREGKIALSDLVNQRGRPLTLGELRQRHGIGS